ncbi:molybdopterin synthase sulfur carrier subunit [Alteribacillus persepolensis]|uniref:Molybdopterin synthase sulfur carrier subunit n=1 Tax=Alteribacillus persepolensis TaxID=568899 RepID=A0A1G8JK90_9BACI|nr:molybdopterin converting factor subunit 1 [Alteribacillus persepolensis]SDI31615.1 molybdopterin synthase sulfur carrier subunit [Alteribacillus persepolensis]
MIKILFFARLQEEMGTESIEVEKAGYTVRDVKEWLADNHQLSTISQTMVAINEDYANDDDMVNESDTIAFIPPVSGG